MKNSKVIVLVLSIVLFAFSANNSYAQKKSNCCSKAKMEYRNDCSKIIPNLTDAQKVKTEKLKADHLAAVEPLKAKLKENREAHRKFMAADKVDQKSIEANIDAHAKIKAEMMKLQSKHVASVKALLNDEQKKAFDEHHAKKMGDCCNAAPKGKGKGKHKMCR